MSNASTLPIGEAERRDAVRRQILDAAARVTADPDVLAFTFDAVAEEAGVGRRTVFRYFPSRDDLLAATIDHIVSGYLQSVPSRQGRPLEEWLTDVVDVLVEANAGRGPCYFDLVLGRHGPAVAAALARRSEARMNLSDRLAHEVWAAAGRPGRAPAWLAHALTIALGPFAPAALIADAQLDIGQISHVIRSLLLAAVEGTGSGDSG